MPPPTTFVSGFPISVPFPPLPLPPPPHHYHHQHHVNKRPRTGLPLSLHGSRTNHPLHSARSFARPHICCACPAARQQHGIEQQSDVNANSISSSPTTSTSTSSRRLTSFVLAAATATGVLLAPIPGIGQQSHSKHSSNSSVDWQRHQATAVRVGTAVACGSVVARSVTRVMKKTQSETRTDEKSTAVMMQQEYTDKNNNEVSKNKEWQQQQQEKHDFATTNVENDIVNDFLLLDDDSHEHDSEHKPGTTTTTTTNSINTGSNTATETTLHENPDSSSNVNVAREQAERPSGTYSYAFKKPSRKNKQPSSSTDPSGGNQSSSSSSTGSQSSTDERVPSYDKDRSSSDDTSDIGSFSFSHMRAEFLAESSTSPSSSSTAAASPSSKSSYESTASTSVDDVEQSWFQNVPLSSSSSKSNIRTSASTGSTDDSSDTGTSSVSQEPKSKRGYAHNDSSSNNRNSSSLSSTNNRKNRRVTTAGPVSSGELARRLLGAPVVFLRDVVAPTADLVSVGWHDLRVNVEDLLDGKLDRVVLSQDEIDDVDVDDDVTWERDMMSFRDDWDWVKRTVGVQEEEEERNREGEGQGQEDHGGNASNGERGYRDRDEQFNVNKLSVEERQILRVQNMARSIKNGLFSQLDKFIKHRNNT